MRAARESAAGDGHFPHGDFRGPLLEVGWSHWSHIWRLKDERCCRPEPREYRSAGESACPTSSHVLRQQGGTDASVCQVAWLHDFFTASGAEQPRLSHHGAQRISHLFADMARALSRMTIGEDQRIGLRYLFEIGRAHG